MNTIETRLRSALSARAAQVTTDRLQPALPPTLRPATRARRVWWWFGLAAVALAVVALGLVRALPRDPVRPSQPQPPAAAPSSAPASAAASSPPAASSSAPASPLPAVSSPAPSPPVSPPGSPVRSQPTSPAASLTRPTAR